MINTYRARFIFVLISGSILFSGCATTDELMQAKDYPPDIPILINNVPYEINSIKCAKITSVNKNGSLDCYDSDGFKSLPITPVSEWRRNGLKEHWNLEWGSEDHQAFMYYFYYGGGKEEVGKNLQNYFDNFLYFISVAKLATNTQDALDKSKEIKFEEAGMKIQSGHAYIKGGIPAWHAHQIKIAQWRTNNVRYVLNKSISANKLFFGN